MKIRLTIFSLKYSHFNDNKLGKTNNTPKTGGNHFGILCTIFFVSKTKPYHDKMKKIFFF